MNEVSFRTLVRFMWRMNFVMYALIKMHKMQFPEYVCKCAYVLYAQEVLCVKHMRTGAHVSCMRTGACVMHEDWCTCVMHEDWCTCVMHALTELSVMPI